MSPHMFSFVIVHREKKAIVSVLGTFASWIHSYKVELLM